ncbi:MFS transporter prlG [Paramyrothecium foliicola]|nr:MFS transporter prlG [Paramyrothecium foliicola]
MAPAQPQVLTGSETSNHEEPSGDESSPIIDLGEGVVGWESQEDPQNPRNFAYSRKMVLLGLVSFISFLSSLASSIPAPGSIAMSNEFGGVSGVLRSFATSIYVLGLALGPLLLSPLSEIYGRQIVLNCANVWLSIWQIPCALAPNVGSLIAYRFLAGAGGSVSLTIGGGVISDLFPMRERGLANSIFTIGPLFGPVLGPILGGFISERAGWRWVYWVLLAACSLSTALVMALGRETNHVVLLRRRTWYLSKSMGRNDLVCAYDAKTTDKDRTTLAILARATIKPLRFLATSPIVPLLAVYMAFVFGLLYLLLTTVTVVFKDTYGWDLEICGLAYLGLGLGFTIGLVIVAWTSDATVARLTKANGGIYKPEMRLAPCIIFAFFVPISFFWYGWATQLRTHWIVPVLGLAPFGFGMMGIFAPIQTYAIDIAGHYAASVLAALTTVRCIFGIFLPLAGPQMFARSQYGISWSMNLATLSLVFTANLSKAPADLRLHPNFTAIQGDLSDLNTIDFSGSDGVLLTTPAAFESPSATEHTKRIIDNVSAAIRKAGSVKRLVYISSIGAQHHEGVGEVKSNYESEVAYRDLVGEVVYIRNSYFMDNWRPVIATAKADQPFFYSTITPVDFKMPMVSSLDVGATCAAELLSTGTSLAESPRIVNQQGPEWYSTRDVQKALEKIAGKSVEVKLVSPDALFGFYQQVLPPHLSIELFSNIEAPQLMTLLSPSTTMAIFELAEVDEIEITSIITDELDPISPSPHPAVQHQSHFMGVPLTDVGNPEQRGGARSEMKMTTKKGDQKRTLLFDAGPEPGLWERNCNLVGHQIGAVECIALSHYHRDHSGGLLKAIEKIHQAQKLGMEKVVVDLHPDRPVSRGVQSPYGPISLEADPSFEEVESKGARLTLSDTPHTVMDGAFLVSGEVPRVTPFEKGFPGGLRFFPSEPSGEWKPDELLMDERYVVCHLRGKGLIIFTGCGHAGVVNTVLDAQRLCPNVPVYCVAGGYHLSDATPEKMSQTVDAMARIEPHVLLAAHCTGWRFKQEMEKVRPGIIVPVTVDNVVEISSLRAMVQTCKAFYSMLAPRLHRRIAVAAGYHAHIPKLIRNLEPYLSITQKKQLKKEGKYKGQQERYPSHLDPDAVPPCTAHVRQLVVGYSDPGKKHQYIVKRYIEEALKNLENLETVQTRIFTHHVARGLASLKHLKALDLYCNDNNKNEDATPLAEIKGLKHLSLDEHSWSASQDLIQSLNIVINNSASTLESLQIKTSGIHSIIALMRRRTKGYSVHAPATAPEKLAYPKLKSLHFACHYSESRDIGAFVDIIDFAQLEELTIGSMGTTAHVLFRKLADLSKTPGMGLTLKSFSLPMRMNSYDSRQDLSNNIEAVAYLISSFDTLERLTIQNYGEYPEQSITTNPGIDKVVLRAILKHKNLKALHLPYWGKAQGLGVPYMSAETAEAIIDGLPRLQELEFAPEELEMKEIAQSLSRGTNLTSIHCALYTSWINSYPPPPEDPHIKMATTIVKAFLDSPRLAAKALGGKGETGGFNWDHDCALRTVRAAHVSWQLSSSIPKKRGKNADSPGEVWSEDLKRKVCYRTVAHGVDQDAEWLKKVDGPY